MKPHLSEMVNQTRAALTTYRLTNPNRGEPDHALFEVPTDYTVRENNTP